MEKFTIKDLAEGKCAILNDGKVADLKIVIKKAFPKYDSEVSGDATFYYAYENDKNMWAASIGKPNIPVQSVNVFMEEIIKANEFTPKFGDKVLASNNDKNWMIGKFITHTDNKEYKYAVIDWTDACEDNNYVYNNAHTLVFYKYIKPFKVRISKNEIAEWKGCNVEDIEIV